MPKEWDFFNRREVGAASVIHAIEYTLNQDELGEHDIAIYADTVNINSPVRLPGRKVMIHARYIVCQGEAILDVSGEDLSSDGQPRAQDGRNFGESGQNGTEGQAGKPGGTVHVFAESIDGQLTVMAHGGKGGRGQNGGNGIKGAIGPTGADGSGEQLFSPGQIGGKGGTGGNGGIGGKGGRGGDAGSVEIHAVDLSEAGIQVLAQPGIGGNGGAAGQAGGPGEGGLGGHNQRCRRTGSLETDFYWTCSLEDRVGKGPEGSSGTAGSEGPPGEVGTPKDFIIRHITHKELGNIADISQCLMTLHRIQLDYLKEDYQPVVTRLGWLYRITEESPGRETPVGNDLNSPSPTSVKASDEEWAALRTQVITLMAQLSGGLDFYGLPQNYAPLVAYEFYKNQIETILAICKDIELSYKGYVDDVNAHRNEMDSIDAALISATKLLNQFKERKDQSVRETNSLQSLIAVLLERIQEQRRILEEADDAFQNAVAAVNGCSAGDVLKVAFTVGVAAYTGYVNVSNIVEVLEGQKDSEIFKNIKGEISPERRLIKRLQASKGDAQSLLDAFNKIKDTLNSTYDDSGKIIVSEEDYEATLKPYLNLPEAQRYRELIRTHIETIKTRNQKIQDYEGELALQLQLAAQIQQCDEEIKRVKEIKAESSDPSLIEFKTFMGRLNTQSKQLLIKVLYMERKAWEYWALETHPFNVIDQEVTALANIHLELLTSELEVRHQRASAPTPIKGIKIVLSEADSPDVFTKFRDSKKLVFTIELDNPEFNFGWYGVLAKHVEVSLPNVKTANNQLRFKLIHNGRAQFLTQDSQLVEFSHKARVTTIVRSLDGNGPTSATENNLGGKEGEYAFLSPFAVWSLDFTGIPNPGLDLSEVKEVVLTFDALGLGLG